MVGSLLMSNFITDHDPASPASGSATDLESVPQQRRNGSEVWSAANLYTQTSSVGLRVMV